MKKTRFVHDNGFRLALMSMLTLFTFCSCSAHPNNANGLTKQSQEQTDSVMKSAIGDSIYSIIAGTKKIKAEEIILTNDTTESTLIPFAINIKGKYAPLVQFILSNPKNYGGDATVYGLFLPCFKLTFTKANETCILNFDFGLKKWSICDDKGKVIKRFDLPTDDMLRFAHMLFPNNELYKKQINTEAK